MIKQIMTIGTFTLFSLSACANHSTETQVQEKAQQIKSQSEAEVQKKLDAAPDIITEAVYPFPAEQPNFGPEKGSISFVDTDPGETIGGTLTMRRAINDQGEALNEAEQGISMYMIHWGLEVGEPGVEDDAGAGDHGGDCKGFRDTGHVVMALADELDGQQTMTWEIPQGTEVPADAVYFVGHAIYGKIHNLGKCTQTSITNLVNN